MTDRELLERAVEIIYAFLNSMDYDLDRSYAERDAFDFIETYNREKALRK